VNCQSTVYPAVRHQLEGDKMSGRTRWVVSSGLALVLAASVAASAGVSSPQSGVQKFFADVEIDSAFRNALGRSPDDSEKRLYRVRIFEDHWSLEDIERDLRGRRDYWRHDDERYRQEPSYSQDRRDIDDMIRRAYRDVLGREADTDGLRLYRSNVMERGWTERQVRDALRSSPEHRTNPTAAADRVIKRAYNDVLGRDPDPAGLYEYRNKMTQHGWDEHDVREALRNSPELRQKANISEAEARAIVRRAYRSVLGREPDPAAEGYVQRVLREHWGEREVARELRNSPEYLNKQR
jgi:hypothetical protein